MELLVDREITAASAAFAPFGAVRLFEGRSLRHDDLGAAEVLLVRSVTRVDADLLRGSAVRFVGTATAGLDHIDQTFLAAAGIRFCDAAGCNAGAVAEHVLCCVVAHAHEQALDVRELRVGIVGYGHVGRALGALLRRLNIAYVVSDPPQAAAIHDASVVALDEVLACDVVTLHVPLTRDGAHPTWQLLDGPRLERLAPGSLLINAARGGVIDEAALLRRLSAGPPLSVALDCWSGEPAIDTRLAARVWRASPHIAGHSHEARAQATALLHAAVAQETGLAAPLPDLTGASLEVPLRPRSSLAEWLEYCHPLAAHTTRARALAELSAQSVGERFDADRKKFGLRREFAAYRIAPDALDTDTVRDLHGLGFALNTAGGTNGRASSIP